jgi:hypothetical protein
MRAAVSPFHRASIASRRAFSRSGSPRAASMIAWMAPLSRAALVACKTLYCGGFGSFA